MTCVTEAHAISRRLIGSASQPSELMTSATRRDVSPVDLCIWRVTAKTGDVSIQSRRNRKANATAIAPVTRDARRATVFRVIEPRVEAPQRWKGFDLSILSVRVTDRADLARWI